MTTTGITAFVQCTVDGDIDRDIAEHRVEREHQRPHQRQHLVGAPERSLLPLPGAPRICGAYCAVNGSNANDARPSPPSTPLDSVVA